MKFILFANTDWYLYNFRLTTALRLKQSGHEVVMLSPPGEFGARFADHGLRWLKLDNMDRASLNPLRELATLRSLTAKIKAERPDLIHNFTVKCAVYGALAARLCGVPAVVNAVAGMGYVFTSDDTKARVLRPLVKVLMRGTLGHGNSRLILQNPDDADAFVRSNLVSPERIRLIRSSGVDTQRFQPVAQQPDAPLRVLLAARLLREKGIVEYAEASRLLRQQGRSIQFLLAGMPDPGNPKSVDRATVEGWQRDGLLQWLGHVDDMPALMRQVNVMALPSYYREGVPKSLIEGAASGLAIVTTDLPGCREVVGQDGIDGLHVAPRDAADLARVLARLDDDRQLLARLAARARSKAISDFDERAVIDRTIDVYNEILPVPVAS